MCSYNVSEKWHTGYIGKLTYSKPQQTKKTRSVKLAHHYLDLLQLSSEWFRVPQEICGNYFVVVSRSKTIVLFKSNIAVIIWVYHFVPQPWKYLNVLFVNAFWTTLCKHSSNAFTINHICSNSVALPENLNNGCVHVRLTYASHVLECIVFMFINIFRPYCSCWI